MTLQISGFSFGWDRSEEFRGEVFTVTTYKLMGYLDEK